MTAGASAYVSSPYGFPAGGRIGDAGRAAREAYGRGGGAAVVEAQAAEAAAAAAAAEAAAAAVQAAAPGSPEAAAATAVRGGMNKSGGVLRSAFAGGCVCGPATLRAEVRV
jgi:hypothetical protein